MALTLESVDTILKCDYSNESYWAVLSCDAVYYTVDKVILSLESVQLHREVPIPVMLSIMLYKDIIFQIVSL